MAPLPVIGNCIRVGLRWNAYAGVRPYNVFHLITNTTDLPQLALDIGEAMTEAGTELFGPVLDQYFVNSVDLTPLDGTSATVQHGLGATFTGGTGGQPVMQVAALISQRTPQRGSRGRGRLYLGPISENAMDAGNMTSYLAVTAAWQDFADFLPTTSSVASMGVASYTHAEVNGVTSIFCDQLVATQRRRMNQLR